MTEKSHLQNSTWKEIVYNTINYWSESKRVFHSSSQIITKLLNDHKNEINVSPSTIRRYLKSMNFYYNSAPYGSTSYGFNNPRVFLNNLVTYLDCQKHICFLLKEPSLGSLLAEHINTHYSSRRVDLGNYIHCVAINDLLICFYKESPNKNITAEHLAYEIPTILSQIYLARNI